MESRGMAMSTLMVAAIVLCIHRPAMAAEVAEQFDSELAQQGVELAEGANSTTSPWTVSQIPNCRKFLFCVKDPSTSCITECCDSFDARLPLLQKCICWRIAERMARESLTALQNYCGLKKPTLCPHLQGINQKEVAESSEATDNNSSINQQQPTCCSKDKEKIKTCMLNTASIDQCCPTFKIMLGSNCDCYNYAKDLDNLALITLENYCDVTNPCKRVQAM